MAVKILTNKSAARKPILSSEAFAMEDYTLLRIGYG